MRRRSLPCLLSVLNTHSRATFRPSSPNYGDVFVNDAARQRLRINSARHWTDKVEHRLQHTQARWERQGGRESLSKGGGSHAATLPSVPAFCTKYAQQDRLQTLVANKR